MSPPSPDEQDAALAALTGTVTEQKPGTELARNLLRLRLAMDAKNAGVPWTAIGQALGGISGKAAKAHMKHLARDTQRQLLASRKGKGRIMDYDRSSVPGWEGSIGPGPGQHHLPHVYARDVCSGAGNCVCGRSLGDERHVQAAPGVPVPDRFRHSSRLS